MRCFLSKIRSKANGYLTNRYAVDGAPPLTYTLVVISLLLFPNSYIISAIKIRHHTFYARPRCKEIPLCQQLRGSWRNATNMCMGNYKFVVLPNPYIIKRDQD